MISFLSNRQQIIGYNGYWSEWCTLSEGMPQGSYLGPLCYIISNDSLRIESDTGVMLHKFVDDTTVTEIYGKGEVTPPRNLRQRTKIRRAENKKSQNSAKNSAIIN